MNTVIDSPELMRLTEKRLSSPAWKFASIRVFSWAKLLLSSLFVSGDSKCSILPRFLSQFSIERRSLSPQIPCVRARWISCHFLVFFFDYSQRHDCFFLLLFIEIRKWSPSQLREITYLWISKIEQRHAQKFALVVMTFEISLTFILPRQNWVTDICNCHLRCVTSWMSFSMTSLQISVIQFCLVKTALQISLSVVSTSHNYVTDILNYNSNYPKCNYD